MKLCPACSTAFGSDVWHCPSCQWRAETRNGIEHVLADGAQVADGFSSEQFANLLTAEPTHFWFAARNALIAWALARYCPDARSFLDVGSGTGQVAVNLRRRLPHLHIVALEGSLQGLTAMGETPGIGRVHADAAQVPYEAEFDVAGAFDVLEHIPDDHEVVRQLVRAVKPGGGIVVTVPQHPLLWGPLDEYSGHQRRYTRRQLVQLLRGAGLRVERVTSFVSLLLPALLVSRAAQRGPVDPRREFRISDRINRAAGLAMAVERAAIRCGVPLPAGGSLLAVARRQ